LPSDSTLASSDSFSATLAPGGIFTYTFSLTGTHPYFLVTALQFRGRVIVQPGSPLGTLSLSATPSSGTVPLTVLYTASEPGRRGADLHLGLRRWHIPDRFYRH
jgi:hypothetical protein